MQQLLPSDDDEHQDGDNRRGNLAVLVVAVVVVVAGVWLVNKLVDMRNMQNCLQSGRTNCVPINPRAR